MKHFLFLALLIGGSCLAQAQSFAPMVSYKTGSSPVRVAVGDVDKDGYPDIVVANSVATASVFLNKKDGTFGAAVSYLTGTFAGNSGVALSDVNLDGYLDLVLCDEYANLCVLLNKKNGTFAPFVQYLIEKSSNPISVATGDVNGDGYPDVVVSTILTANTKGYSIRLLLNKKDGTFGPTQDLPGYSTSYGLALTDVNSDGALDIVSPEYYSSYSSNGLSVLLNKKDGTFLNGVDYRTGTTTYAVATADLNADGFPDIVTSQLGSTVAVLFNKKNGTFMPSVEYFTGQNTAGLNGYPLGLAIGDLNNDGSPDIVISDANESSAGPLPNYVGVLLNKKDGTFSPVVTFPIGTGTRAYGAAVADVNKDGKLDIITANYGTSTMGVLLNQTALASQPGAAPPQAQVTVSPNPSSGTATVTATGLAADARSTEATLTDALGRVVRHLTLSVAQGEAHSELATAELAAGLYLLRLTARDAQGQAVGVLPVQRVSVQ